jgi:LemA protein
MALVLLVVLGLVLLVICAYVVSVYNGLIFLTNNIAKAWANIDVLLKQRHDELPKLIKVCEGYMTHEREVFDRVMKAREVMMQAKGPAEKGAAESALHGSLRQLFALAENYPQLKAQSSFQQVQERVSSLESQIADRREFYNDSVNTYNIRIASIPDVFVARLLGMSPREMFQVTEEDRRDVDIRFSSTAS